LTDLGSCRAALARIKSWQRPLYARAASDNAGSLRVLKKAGFQAVETECSFAPARKTEIEETILRKD
jgi:RimJ/RimL family protein N-acetyltransferase